jgi:hypothetical protein
MSKVRKLDKVKITGISADGKAVGRKDRMVVFTLSSFLTLLIFRKNS